VGTHARDKDGVVAAMLISEMAAYYHDKDMSLYDALIDLYNRVGYFKEDMISLTLSGIAGLEKIKDIMEYYRVNGMDEIAGINVIEVKDYSKGIDGLPKSNVLKFILEDSSWVAARPSGTEPKLKFYMGTFGENINESNEKSDAIKKYLQESINKLI
ncbi:MAG: phospho-sugar mutase, partial [Peptostreptococcaceae bacterium]|nr:phospho-sugar mutase [Peptostreptococcaceae bacterium]